MTIGEVCTGNQPEDTSDMVSTGGLYGEEAGVEKKQGHTYETHRHRSRQTRQDVREDGDFSRELAEVKERRSSEKRRWEVVTSLAGQHFWAPLTIASWKCTATVVTIFNHGIS